ncbi:MAG: hypothetical protein ACFFEF_08815 [Candidatus Thorarchaeota archaeon]
MLERTRIDDEDDAGQQQTNNDLQQGSWFDDGLYQEWLVFLYGIWNRIDYL